MNCVIEKRKASTDQSPREEKSNQFDFKESNESNRITDVEKITDEIYLIEISTLQFVYRSIDFSSKK